MARTAQPTLEELQALPPVMDLLDSAELLGLSKATAYRKAADGTWPTRLLRIGRLYRVPTQGPDGLLAVLGVRPPGDGGDDRAA